MTVARRSLPAALALLVLGAIAPVAGAAVSPNDSALTPELAKLAKPSVRSLSHRAQANAIDFPVSGPGSLIREGGRVLVEVRFEDGAVAHISALKRAGAVVVVASRRYQTVTASVAPVDLPALSAVSGVGSVTPVPAPAVHAAGSCEGGSVISEGVEQLGVADLSEPFGTQRARETFGLRGAGVTVGILSDSFDLAADEAFGTGAIATHAHEDEQSNDLPGPAGTCSGQQVAADVIDEAPDTLVDEVGDEGRAMAQIVHDVAPHAKLAFATAFRSELSFAQNIEALARPVSEGGAGAQVIVDDVSYFEEPFFQDGPVANAIAKVSSEGVTYLTAAGNDNLFDSSKRAIGSWEAPEFRDAPSCPTTAQEYLVDKGVTPNCMGFNPASSGDGGFKMTVKRESELTVDLQWAEPWNGVKADLDAFLVTGGQVVAKAERNNIAIQKPVELLHWENTKSFSQEVELVINRCTGKCNEGVDPEVKPGIKFILMGGVTKTEYPTSSEGDVVGPTVYGHAASTKAITLGAVRYDSTAPETYSSRGPATHLFGPVSGTTPAPALEAPEEIDKPDVVATDCGGTTFFATKPSSPKEPWRFCGTSAAAPHAAAIAALMIQGAVLTPEQVATGLEGSALPIPGFETEPGDPPNPAVGHGLLDAKAALEAVGATPTTADPPSTPVPPLETETEEEVEYKPEPPQERETGPVTPVPNPGGTPEPPGPGPGPPVRLAPATTIARHPGRIIHTSKRTVRVGFAFGTDQSGVGFLCQFDGAPYRRCGARVSRFFGIGPHVLRVKARAGGVVDATPAVFQFRVVWSR